MNTDSLENLLKKINEIKVAVYGDFCLDAYWTMDPRRSEVSVETGLQAEAVAKHSYSLGGASNVVANLAALRPAEIKIFGARGEDIYGREMTSQLLSLGVNTDGLVSQEKFFTYVFCKRILEGNELARFDFEHL